METLLLATRIVRPPPLRITSFRLRKTIFLKSHGTIANLFLRKTAQHEISVEGLDFESRLPRAFEIIF